MNRLSHVASDSPAAPGLSRKIGLAAVGLLFLSTGAWGWEIQSPQPVLESHDLTSGAGKSEKLPRVLAEISGLATTPDGRLFAHGDERAIIYQIDPDVGEIIKAFAVGPGGVKGDFEGMAVWGERFFLSTSTGAIVEFREGTAGQTVDYEVYSTGLENQCELEGLAFDETTGALLLPCKLTRKKELEGRLVVFSVPLSTMRPDPTPRILLALEELDARGLDKGFSPSAIEVHPETHSLILVAAREEALVELSPSGEILGTRKLKRKEHPQPEGVAFLADQSLVLADEGQGKRGTVTRYPRKAPETVGNR